MSGTKKAPKKKQAEDADELLNVNLADAAAAETAEQPENIASEESNETTNETTAENTVEETAETTAEESAEKTPEAEG